MLGMPSVGLGPPSLSDITPALQLLLHVGLESLGPGERVSLAVQAVQGEAMGGPALGGRGQGGSLIGRGTGRGVCSVCGGETSSCDGACGGLGRLVLCSGSTGRRHALGQL